LFHSINGTWLCATVKSGVFLGLWQRARLVVKIRRDSIYQEQKPYFKNVFAASLYGCSN